MKIPITKRLVIHGGVSGSHLKARRPRLKEGMLYDWGTLSDHGPRSLKQDKGLAVNLLTPGFSQAYHQRALGVSNATLWKYMQWARELVCQDRTIAKGVAENVSSINRDDGLLMARRRGSSHLPFWSRLAIAEALYIYKDAGSVADLFKCSVRTVHNVRAGRCISYDLLSGHRVTSSTQTRPPARAQIIRHDDG